MHVQSPAWRVNPAKNSPSRGGNLIQAGEYRAPGSMAARCCRINHRAIRNGLKRNPTPSPPPWLIPRSLNMDGNVFLPLEKRNGQFHGSGTVTNERGCTRDSFDLSLDLSLSLSFRSSRDSNLTRIHPLLSNSIVSSFARSLVRSFARFLNLVKRDWKLCSFVGALQRLAAGNSARQILRTRNWLDSISKGWGRKGRGGASSRVVK